MKPARPLLFSAALVSSACAATGSPPVTATPKNAESNRWNLSLLPTGLTPNPTLEMTVFTEMTDAGRALPVASPEQPMYYVAHSTGFHPMGTTVAGEHPPPAEELARILDRTLAARGFVPAQDSVHPPTLALIYFWGSHNRLDSELALLFPELQRQFILERASLVGGKAWQRKVEYMIDYGSTPADHTTKLDYLSYQSNHDLYYVVVSAYRYDELAHNARHLVWRTTMTVNAQGVSMKESMAPLIVTAGDYFGRATPEPAALRRNVKRGTVDLGPLRVIEGNVSLPPESKE